MPDTTTTTPRRWWLAHRYPAALVTEARQRAGAHGHTLPAGRFSRIGLSYQAVCVDCGLAAWVYPAFPWEEAIRGYATTEPCQDWRDERSN